MGTLATYYNFYDIMLISLLWIDTGIQPNMLQTKEDITTAWLFLKKLRVSAFIFAILVYDVILHIAC